jgi:hypothetical protein
LIRLEDGDQLSGLERIDGLAAEGEGEAGDVEAGDTDDGDADAGDAADDGSGGPDGEAGGGPAPPSAGA